MTLWQDVDRMDAMSRSLCHIVATEDAGSRLDALCAARGLYASRSAAARAIEEGRVFVNGATVSKKHAVAAGDTIVYEVDDEPESVVVYGEPIDLDIRFEDEDMLVLSKQIGLVCHPSVDHAHGTLVNALIWHCGEENLCNVQGEEADRLGIVHRLDRDTSGLIIAAKNDYAHQFLSAQLADHTLARTYECIVVGNLREDSGTVDAPIARDSRDRKRMAVVPGGRRAVTHWEVIARYPGYTHVRCRLETGRTHQIRVHMAYLGHPILGDTVYGAKKAVPGLTGQCLHAVGLQFIHPRTKDLVSLTCPLPEEFTAMLRKIDR